MAGRIGQCIIDHAKSVEWSDAELSGLFVVWFFTDMYNGCDHRDLDHGKHQWRGRSDFGEASSHPAWFPLALVLDP